MVDWQERIAINTAVCHGRACIRGTRVMVSVIHGLQESAGDRYGNRCYACCRNSTGAA